MPCQDGMRMTHENHRKKRKAETLLIGVFPQNFVHSLHHSAETFSPSGVLISSKQIFDNMRPERILLPFPDQLSSAPYCESQRLR